MSDEDTRSQAVRDILDELAELKKTLGRLERLVEQIALSMGINPHG